MSISRQVASPVFALLAIVQALRFVRAWPVSINGVAVPLWASAVAALVFGTLAVLVWRDGGRRRR
jgi:hypothetical protein